MKTYILTEEQVRKAMNDYVNTSSDLDNVMDVETAIIGRLTPIELPSDEEIEEAYPIQTKIINDNSAYYEGHKGGFIDGADWMKEQILNQNK